MKDLGPLYKIDVVPEHFTSLHVPQSHRTVRLQAAVDPWADPSLLDRYTRNDLLTALEWAVGVMERAAVVLVARLRRDAYANNCDCCGYACGDYRATYVGETREDGTTAFAQTPFAEVYVPVDQLDRWVRNFAQTVNDVMAEDQRALTETEPRPNHHHAAVRPGGTPTPTPHGGAAT